MVVWMVSYVISYSDQVLWIYLEGIFFYFRDCIFFILFRYIHFRIVV